MNKLIAILALACMSGTGVYAQTATTSEQHAPKKPVAHKQTVNSPAAKAGKVLDDDDKEFDGSGTAVIDVICELGNKLTLYRNVDDKDHMALRWNQRVHRMTRVSTTTGANRFENEKFGLIWIGIPAKGMLLDSKRGKQLANECKDAEQMTPKTVEVFEPTKPANIPPAIEAPKASQSPAKSAAQPKN